MEVAFTLVVAHARRGRDSVPRRWGCRREGERRGGDGFGVLCYGGECTPTGGVAASCAVGTSANAARLLEHRISRHASSGEDQRAGRRDAPAQERSCGKGGPRGGWAVSPASLKLQLYPLFHFYCNASNRIMCSAVARYRVISRIRHGGVTDGEAVICLPCQRARFRLPFCSMLII
jgi:hypothetical protein